MCTYVACHLQCCGSLGLEAHRDRSQSVLVLVLRAVRLVLLFLLKSRLELILYYVSHALVTGNMYQVADNLLNEIIYLLTVIQSLWNGMVPLFVGMIGRSFRL